MSNNQSNAGNENYSTANESVDGGISKAKPHPAVKKMVILENDESFRGEVMYEVDRYVRKGYGIYHYPNGDIYEGHWDNDKKNGLGEYIYTDGSIYRGEWKDDMKHGIGTLIANGHEFEGEWANDELKNAFIFSINLPEKIVYEDDGKLIYDKKNRNKSGAFTLASVDNNTSLKSLDYEMVLSSFNTNHNKLLEKLEENNNFSVHVELLSLILEEKSKYQDIFQKTWIDSGLCEICCCKNENRRVKFDFQCKKFKSFLKIYFNKISSD